MCSSAVLRVHYHHHRGSSSSYDAVQRKNNLFLLLLRIYRYPHLRKVLDYLTYGCTVSELRGISFLALGQLSLVIPYHLSSCLGEVVAVVKEGLSPINRRKGYVLLKIIRSYCAQADHISEFASLLLR